MGRTWMLAGLAVALLGTPLLGNASRTALLMLTDATFTDEVVDRQPGTRLESYQLNESETSDRLWFWFRLKCEDCGELTEGMPEIPIYVKWAHEQDGTFVVTDTITMVVRGESWRGWTYKEHLLPGTWRVVVFSETGPICLEENCAFTLEVTS